MSLQFAAPAPLVARFLSLLSVAVNNGGSSVSVLTPSLDGSSLATIIVFYYS
jgi:hypothetical protein